MIMKLLIFYQTNATTYGHLRMAHSLASHLVAKGHEVSFVCLGKNPTDFALDSRLSVYEISAVDELTSLVDSFEPSHFITEFFPFGRAKLRSEMRALLTKLKQSRADLKIISTMREFVARESDPNRPDKLEKHQRRINYDLVNFYDQLLIFAPPRLKSDFDVSLNEEFLDSKTKWCGYLIPELDPHTKVDLNELLIGFGGAANPQAIVRVINDLRAELELRINVYYSHQAQQQASVDPLKFGTLCHFTNDFPQRLQQAGLAILYSGYGNSIERLHSGLPTLFIATEGHLEQQLRLKTFSELSHIRTLTHEEINTENIREKLKELLSLRSDRRQRDLDDFQGAANATTYLEML